MRWIISSRNHVSLRADAVLNSLYGCAIVPENTSRFILNININDIGCLVQNNLVRGEHVIADCKEHRHLVPRNYQPPARSRAQQLVILAASHAGIYIMPWAHDGIKHVCRSGRRNGRPDGPCIASVCIGYIKADTPVRANDKLRIGVTKKLETKRKVYYA